VWKLFIPFMVYLFLFIFTRTFSFEYKMRTEWESRDNWYYCHIFLTVLIFPLILYFGYTEVKQYLYRPDQYITDLWNGFDLVSIALNLVVILLDISQSEKTVSGIDTHLRGLSAVACFFMYVKLFYFLRIFKLTAPLVRMIVDVTFSIKVFVLLFLVFLLASANSFYILSAETRSNEEQFIQHEIDALLYSYLISLGEFDMEFKGPSKWLLWIFFTGSTFFLLIVLLNLIIAIMGSAYEKLSEMQESSLIQEQLNMIIENSFLVDRAEFFKGTSYLISVEEDDEDEEEEQET